MQRIISALALSLACGVSAAACAQSPDTNPGTLQTTEAEATATESINLGSLVSAETILGDLCAGTIEGGNLAHFDLGDLFNLGDFFIGDFDDRGSCEIDCVVKSFKDSALCLSCPDSQQHDCTERTRKTRALCLDDCADRYPI